MCDNGNRRRSKLKGQINLEFLAAAFIYMAALGGIVLAGQGVLPAFTGDVKEASLHLEARQVSTEMLTTPGAHSFPEVDEQEWEYNDTTIEQTTSFGLASDFLVVERDKLESIKTVDHREEDNYFNYTQFRDVTDADHQYRFEFTWMPLINTSGSFTRGEGDQNDPEIDEPLSGERGEYYNTSGNVVHYGKETLNRRDYYFLVTSHDGVFNTTYVSETRDFQGRSPIGVGDTFTHGDEPFEIERFQNRENKPGTMLIVSRHIKTFGSNPGEETRVVNLNRYAVMDNEPLKVKTLVW